MADNGLFNNQKIYVETDYQNIVIVDPNKVIDNGEVQERLVNHEELVKYVNLEAKVLPRTKMVVGDNFDDSVQNLRIGTMSNNDQRKINFVFPEGKDAYDTSWTDELTGMDALRGNGLNQTREQEVSVGDVKKTIRKIENPEDTQLLGITNVQIKINTAFAPQVTIEMVDVQGRTLFEQGENSPYSAFMQLPYPLFILTVKGYFGKAVRYELMLKDFNARFDASDGNYKITTNYISRTYAILSDISIHNLYTLPHMYQKTFQIGNAINSTAPSNGIQTEEIATTQTTKGLEILKQVYSEYREKGLIGDDFPNQQTNPLTLPILENKLDKFEKYVMESYGQEDMSVINDIAAFSELINNYRDAVFRNIEGNWFNKYIDEKNNILIPKSKDRPILYGLKPLSLEEKRNSISKLTAIIEEYNNNINNNATFGLNGECIINNEKLDTALSFSLSIDDFLEYVYDLNDVDVDATYTKINRTPPNDIEKIDFTKTLNDRLKLNNIVIDAKTKEVEDKDNNVYFKFGNITGTATLSQKSFLNKLQILEKDFQKTKKIIEDKLAEALAEKIKQPSNLGFNPTIQNVMAVICANADAFFRLMDNVHENSWEQRQNPIRMSAVLNTGIGIEGKNNVNETIDGKQSNSDVVYPWPQYFEETQDDDGNTVFEDKYPGDTSCINRTQGYQYDAWPEIEFVEEYIKASLEIEEQETDTRFPNDGNQTPYISLNAVEFPFQNQPYESKEKIKFFYEIFERSLLVSNYSNFYKKEGYGNSLYSSFGDFEKLNIIQSLNNSFELTEELKNFKFNYENILRYLRSMSYTNSWQIFSRDYFVKDYIKNLIEKDFGVYNDSFMSEDTNSVDASTKSIENIKNYLKSNYSDEIGFLDKFPFSNLQWLKNNTSNGVNINSVREGNATKRVYTFLDSKKTIATFDTNDKENDRKLFTYFEWVLNKSTNPNEITPSIDESINTQSNSDITTNNGVISYYNNRTYDKLVLTESYLNYGTKYNTTVNNVTKTQTTSLLNTPYFINAILKGVENEKNNVQNPYVSLGYLYLNSIPLSTLREKFKSFDGSTTETLDYIFAGLNKFSAIHKLPYLWILKYGSIWHRYKKHIIDGEDILDGVWENFDYKNAYDPIGNNIGKTYNLFNVDNETVEYVMKKTDTTVMNTPTPTVNEIVDLNGGFYPKLTNSIYRYFTGKDILNEYTSEEIQNLNQNFNLKISKTDRGSFVLDKGYDNQNPNRTLSFDNWYQYFEIKNNNDFDVIDSDGDKILIVPSSGYFKFKQAKHECINNSGKLTQEIIDNQSVYNGNVKSFWFASNYGYFNNSYIDKPTPLQYIKYIDPTTDNNQSFNLTNSTNSVYSSIEEIYNVFTKEMLDTFEDYFLNFCKPKLEIDDTLINRGGETFEQFVLSPMGKSIYNGPLSEITVEDEFKLKQLYHNQSNSFGVPPSTNNYDISLYSIMKSLFIINKPELTNDSDENLKLLSETQLDSFISSHSNYFLSRNVILKIGNPGKYNRRVYDSFSTDITFNGIQDRINFGKYKQGTQVPTEGGVSLTQSINANPDAWNSMYLYVGNYSDNDFKYTNNGSYLTDFFIDLDIEFSEGNVILLSNIIKLYASKKKENPQITKNDFFAEYNRFLTEQRDFQTDMLDYVFTQLNKDLPNFKESETQKENKSKLDGEIAKLDLWKTFQTMNDKWVSGQDFKSRTIYEDFLFLDRANRPVGDKIVINVEKLRSRLKTKNSDSTVYTLLGYIYEDNNFVFMPTPTYTNFYGRNDRVKNGEAFNEDAANDVFGTFMEVNTKDTRPRMLGIYVGEPSSNLDMKNNENVRKNSDSFDITQPSGNPLIENQINKTNYSDSNKCVGFNVQFGVRNQGIFKSISLDMNQHRNIGPTFQVLADLGSQATGQKAAQQSQSLYGFYKSKSYTCQITSMGNAMIQPTMYFNLEKVPMFYGPYLIMNVSHSINSNDFVTTFEGVRVSKFSIQQPNSLVLSVNRDIYDTFKKKLTNASKNSLSGATNSQSSNNISSMDESRCEGLSNYPLKEFTPLTKTSVSSRDVADYILTKSDLSTDMKIYLYGITTKGENTVSSNNNNLGNDNINNLNKNMVNTFVDSQICISDNGKAKCIAGFSTYQKYIDMMTEIYKNQQTELTNLRNVSDPTSDNSRAASMTRLLFKNIDKNKYQNMNSTEIKGQINSLINTNTDLLKLYEVYEKIFKNSINKFQ